MKSVPNIETNLFNVAFKPMIDSFNIEMVRIPPPSPYNMPVYMKGL